MKWLHQPSNELCDSIDTASAPTTPYSDGRPIGGAGSRLIQTSGEFGFTLIELMVVIAIIGFASAAVILSIPDPRGRLVEDADRFAARLAAVRDLAVVEARPMAVWVSPSGYGFERYAGGQWIGSDEKPFRTTNWRAGTRALAGLQGARLMIHFDGTGLPSEAARIALEREGEQVSVSLDGAGRVRVGG